MFRIFITADVAKEAKEILEKEFIFYEKSGPFCPLTSNI